jgi:hypothetical protein
MKSEIKTKEMLTRIRELSLIHKCRSSLSFTNRIKGSKPLVMYLIAQKLLKKDKSGCYQFNLRSFPNKLINTIEKEMDNDFFADKESLKMFVIENVPMSARITDSKAVIELAETMNALNSDGSQSILIGLHICKTKRDASNLFLAAKRRLNNKAFISRTILNEAKVYQGTRIWKINQKAK